MLFMTLVIGTVLFVAFLLMSTEQFTHLNRAAVSMFCGTIVCVLYMLQAGDYIRLMHPEEYTTFLAGASSTTDYVKQFVADHVLVKYISEACWVILFLIATNTTVEVMNNNGVFDSLIRWMRMRNSRLFLWILSFLTAFISFSIDNLTTVVLMMALTNNIVRSQSQRVIYACTILFSASVGGCCSVIGDMTSLSLWARGVVTPTALFTGLVPACLTSLVVFNILMSATLMGRVEVVSTINKYDGDDSTLQPWQKFIMLVLGIVGIWFIPTFHYITKLPPFLGALCVMSIIWLVEGLFNMKRNLISVFVQRHYFRNTEFIGMRLILYFFGVCLAVGVMSECGLLSSIGNWLENHTGNVYIYGLVTGAASCFMDNVPVVLMGLNMFSLDTVEGSTSVFVQNGLYWQLLLYCSAMGGALFFVGTLAGQAVLQVAKMKISWYFKNYYWRVLLAWIAGLVVFSFTHI